MKPVLRRWTCGALNVVTAYWGRYTPRPDGKRQYSYDVTVTCEVTGYAHTTHVLVAVGESQGEDLGSTIALHRAAALEYLEPALWGFHIPSVGMDASEREALGHATLDRAGHPVLAHVPNA